MSSLRRLGIQLGQFFGGNLLSMLLGLLTFPILTRALSHAEYGALGLVTTTVSLAVVAAKGGLSDGIIRFLRDFDDTPDRRTLFVSTVVLRAVLLASLVTGVYVAALPAIERGLGTDRSANAAFLVMAIYLWARPLNIVVYNFLRALGRTGLYNVFGVTSRVAAVGLAITLLLEVTHDVAGYLLGTAVAELATTLALFAWLLRRYRVRLNSVSGPLSRRLVLFGLPLLATELLYIGLRSSDRYLVQTFVGEAALGVYAVSATLPGYVNDLVMFSVSYAVVPIYVDLHQREGDAATAAFLAQAFRYYVIAMIAMCAGYWATADDAIIVLASMQYSESAGFSPLILVGLALLGATPFLNAGLYLHRNTNAMLAVMASSVAVNIVINWILLPRLGLSGGAVATVLAGLTSAGLSAAWSFRYLRFEIDWRSAVFYLIAIGPAMSVIARIATGSRAIDLALKVLVGAVYVAALVVWREAEIRAVVTRSLRRFRID